MHQIGIQGDVDTSKYESWPLLRPDELHSLPSGVLRASASDLDNMCRQVAGSDPIVAYAIRQRERTRAILTNRAAQTRVQALLAGTEYVGRERLANNTCHAVHGPNAYLAPSYDRSFLLFANAPSEKHTGGYPNPTSAGPNGPTSGSSHDGDSMLEHSLRSPPRSQLPRGDDVIRTAAVTDATEVVERSENVTSSLLWDVPEGHGGKVPRVARKEHRMVAVCPMEQEPGSVGSTPAALTETEHVRLQQAVSSRRKDTRANPAGTDVGHRLSHARGERVASASGVKNDCVVRDSWGSVFIVGGGRRRRRPAVRKRSSDAEETPAARRAQMEKQRQERRRSSLRRLMARKEQRAKQQAARRKRRAATARAVAATPAVTADADKTVAGTEAVDRSSLATETTRHFSEPAEGGNDGAGTDGKERGVSTEDEGAAGRKIVVESEQSRNNAAVVNDKKKVGTISGQIPCQTRRTMDISAVPRGSGVSLAAITGGCKGSGSGEGSSDAAATASPAAAPAASINLVVRDKNDGCYSSGSESESVSGGDSSEEECLPVDASEICEDVDSNETASGSIARGGLEKEVVSGVTMHHPIPLGGDKEGGVSGCGVRAVSGRSGSSGYGASLEDAGDCRSAVTHDARPGNNVDGDPGFESSIASGETAIVRRGGGSPCVPIRSACAWDIGHLNHGVPASATTARSLHHEYYSSKYAAQEVQAVAVVEGAATRAEEASYLRSTSTIVDASCLRDYFPKNNQDEAMTGTLPSKSDGSDSGMESEEYYKRGDDGAADLVCGERSQRGRANDGLLEFPGPLDVQPLIGIYPTEASLASENGGSDIQEDQPLLTHSAGISEAVRISARFAPDSRVNTTSCASCAGGSRNPKTPGDLFPFTSVPISPPPSIPLESRKTCSSLRPHSADHVAAAETMEEHRGVQQPLEQGVMKGDDGFGAVATSAHEQVPDPPAMEARTHGCRNEIIPRKQDLGSRGNSAGARTRGEPRHDLESPDPDFPKITHMAKVKRDGRDSERVASADCSMTMIDRASTTYAKASRQTFLVTSEERQGRKGSAILQLPEPQVGASDDVSTGSPFKSGDGIAESNVDAAVGTSHSDVDSIRFVKCYPRFAAILTAYHNGRALTRQADFRSLPLTSKIIYRGMAAGGSSRVIAGHRGGIGSTLTAAEEEACLHLQWKLYTIHVRVIKDYATVFSYGDGWSTDGAADEPNSLVYSGDSTALHYRVNSKARPEVYNIVTDVLNNRCEQWEELPTGLGLKTTWNLLWTWSKPHIRYSSLLTWQKVNHFPNSRELTRKDLLNKHVSRFMAPGGRLGKEFHIMPQTFVLPHEFTLFVTAFTSLGRTQPHRRGNTTSGDLDGNGMLSGADDDEDDGFTCGKSGARRGGGKRENLWIMKPVGMSRGRGIRLIDDIKNICYADKVVLQRYIGNPLLLDGYKFDLRLYVLVTSFNKLEAFIYKEGFARLSTHRYKKGDIDNRFIHLTNSSIQRLNEAGAARDSPLHRAKTSEAGGTKTTLSYLWRRLAASGVDVGALWAGICSLVVKSLVCVERSIPNQPNSFELFGYDVLIDDRLRPWLIEVNSSPSMARDTHVDRQVKEALIFETVHLVDPLPFDRQKLVDILGRRLSETQNSKGRTFKQWHHHRQRQPQRSQSQQPFGSETGTSIGGESPSPSARASTREEHHTGEEHRQQRRRTSKEEAELEKDLDDILCGRRPRQVGEKPARMGNFVRLCPGTTAYRHARRLRRKVIRPRPGDDGDDDGPILNT